MLPLAAPCRILQVRRKAKPSAGLAEVAADRGVGARRLDPAAVQDHQTVTQGYGLDLVVGDVDRGDTQAFLRLLGGGSFREAQSLRKPFSLSAISCGVALWAKWLT